jgi:hypothetical protein
VEDGGGDGRLIVTAEDQDDRSSHAKDMSDIRSATVLAQLVLVSASCERRRALPGMDYA